MKDQMNISANKYCTGCECCAYVCPQKCISMVRNDLGFYVPNVDESLCTKCGLCYRKCPSLRPVEIINVSDKWLKTYAINDALDYSASSSGGTISEIARSFIEDGGFFFSTAFDRNWEPVVIRVQSNEDIYKTQGSKYVQSRMKNVYEQVRNLLEDNKKVLFVGTPCQVDALKMFIGDEVPTFYTIDLLCAGVASPGVFERYLSEIIHKYNRIEKLNFRDKTFGYGYYLTSIVNTGAQHIFLRRALGEFSSLCGRGYIRESCLHCKYRSEHRTGDLTAGDYGRFCLSENERKTGATIIAINTKKGEELLYNMGAKLVISKADSRVLEEKLSSLPFCVSRQKEKPLNYESFHKTALCESWKYAYKKYLQDKSLKSRIQSSLPLRFLFFIRNKQ